MKINKLELVENMRIALRDSGDNSFDYDGLLINTLLYHVNKDYLGKGKTFDGNIEAILSNIRARVEKTNILYKSAGRHFPYSYERVFEILIYYLRIVTNSMNVTRDQEVHYSTAEISPEAIVYAMNRKLRFESLDEEWEKKKWNTIYKDTKAFYLGSVENYMKFILLSTYIRYCEIKDR